MASMKAGSKKGCSTKAAGMAKPAPAPAPKKGAATKKTSKK